MMKHFFIIFLIISSFIIYFYLDKNYNQVVPLKSNDSNKDGGRIFNQNQLRTELEAKNFFSENFNNDGIIEESGAISESFNFDWSVSSGAFLIKDGGVGKTILGDLAKDEKWRIYYNSYNPIDTDNGYHPQNIFRLVLRKKWQNFQQESYFYITKYNLSESSERRASNGLLFFNRYQDSDNLYYTGIRVDGHAIIKKKINGKYYTLSEKPFYSGVYNRDTNPNLIPGKKWIGLKTEITNSTDNTVSIKVYIDKDKTGNWILAAETKDDGKTYGGVAILNEGYAGIRTDFMDAEFDDYILKNIN